MPSFPLTLPITNMVNQITLRPRSAQAVVGSPFTFQSQVQVWGGQLWQADINLVPATRASAEALVAALVSLNGFEGSFLLGDTAGKTPRGAATGTPLVNGASQTGASLVTDGWTPSVTGILKAGDWVQLGSGSTARLYKVTADANSDAGGNATLALWPNLRTSPADNAALTVNSAQGRFMLAEQIEWNISARRIYALSFRAVEDLRP